MERFRTAFDLARRLLAGIGHNLGVGSANTFVFLLDMNQVFESYVHAVLESHFQTAVEEQKYVGKLFEVQCRWSLSTRRLLLARRHHLLDRRCKIQTLGKGPAKGAAF